jgi:hypothetical protein
MEHTVLNLLLEYGRRFASAHIMEKHGFQVCKDTHSSPFPSDVVFSLGSCEFTQLQFFRCSISISFPMNVFFW